MGTDIHAVVQAKKNGKWVDVPSQWEQNRHYLLFSWLANVRNGFGFAGVPTYDPIVPIALPRDIPDDFEMDGDNHPSSWSCLDPARQEYYSETEVAEQGIWMGDHTHSWLTADEILSAKRPGKIQRTGVIEIESFKEWDGKSRPAKYSGGIMGPGVVVSPPTKITPETTHVQIEWGDAEDGLDYFVDEIRRLKAEHGDVRVVFGFDS